LFVRSLQKLRAADLGFEPERIVRFTLEFGSGYTLQQRASAHQRVLDRLGTLPEVRSATVSGAGLLGGDGFVERIAVDGYTPQVDEDMRTLAVVAGPRFFETLGISLRAGRGFTSADEMSVSPGGAIAPRIAVVGETFARRFFGDADPLGRTVRFGTDPQQPPLVIVGVAKDVKYRTLREKNEVVIFLPYFGGVPNLPMTVLVKTSGSPRALEATIRTLVRDVDPRVVVTEIVTMDDVVGASLRQERMVAHLGGFFGLFALSLASLGLYGVLSFGVVQRTREIGVRMALGAQQRQVLGLVIGQGVKLTLVGIAVGLLVAFATTHFASKLLYGIPPDDPVTFAGVAAILLGVATLAAWLPARRAAKVDPMVALRCE
jgi:predicted permease